MWETALFVAAAAWTLLAASAVVLARNPLRSALWLIGTLLGTALLYLLLEASFVAAMQVLVYAGAIVVLFVFVIMLLNLGADVRLRPRSGTAAKVLAVAACVYVVGQIAVQALAHLQPGRPVDGTIKGVGTLLLSDFLFSFEAISILLLVAVLGGVVLGIKRLA